MWRHLQTLQHRSGNGLASAVAQEASCQFHERSPGGCTRYGMACTQWGSQFRLASGNAGLGHVGCRHQLPPQYLRKRANPLGDQFQTPTGDSTDDLPHCNAGHQRLRHRHRSAIVDTVRVEQVTHRQRITAHDNFRWEAFVIGTRGPWAPQVSSGENKTCLVRVRGLFPPSGERHGAIRIRWQTLQIEFGFLSLIFQHHLPAKLGFLFLQLHLHGAVGSQKRQIQAATPMDQGLSSKELARSSRVHSREIHPPPRGQQQAVQRHRFCHAGLTAVFVPLRVTVAALHQVMRRLLNPRGVYACYQARVDALGFDNSASDHPTRRAVAHRGSRGDKEPHTACAVVEAFLLTVARFAFRPRRTPARLCLQTDIPEQARQERAMQCFITGILRIGRPIHLGGDHAQLAMQFFPFTHAHRRKKLVAAPTPQGATRTGCPFLLIRAPDFQQRDKVAVRVGELGVFRICSRLGILGSFTRVLHGQHRCQHQHLAQCGTPLGLDQHASKARVHRKPRQLTPQWCDLAVIVHCLQLLQQAVAIVNLARVWRVDEREVLRCT